ncbi:MULTISPECIES: hypothetical protein [Streptomycetaceae]|uniref:Putative lipoprotein n=1 Tax=Streptantibioticus cattleyicolor (strain ATCC 35852 / DSM 46488 / JCM 4925 / NBRC 14057 / NRRL 8057) TaxID=1003195 RepID=F8JSD0_STREN|nr:MULTISPECIES: hypothetical protein [Streptomycetaceae]AEW95445.1 putative lipoprotein [Streptantibioticus cattleyicolor NRRL 8057 = DSM 46488]MYS60013.1 hypothetical protein [Streptomyces sp. SID5468]CCB75787.1 exported protein of unknown function [Streptantibioticus cattleyicolor NRRL 8057 = DSM 46488]
MPPRTSLVIGITGGILTAGTLAIAAPGMVDWYHTRHEQESSYATGRAAKTDRASMPRWLPDGATSIRYRMSTTGGDRLLKATLPEGRLPHDCRPVHRPVGEAHHPRLHASWFPHSRTHHTSAICGGTYNVVLRGTELYGWQDNATWVAANKAADHPANRKKKGEEDGRHKEARRAADEAVR